jgi:hypothetical protein
MFGRHFDHTDHLISKISRESINALKAHFADQMSKDDWRLVRGGHPLWGWSGGHGHVPCGGRGGCPGGGGGGGR